MKKRSIRWLVMMAILLSALLWGNTVLAKDNQQGWTTVYAGLEDTRSNGEAQAPVRRSGFRSIVGSWSYGSQLVGNELAIYRALEERSPDMRRITEAAPIRVTLPQAYQFPAGSDYQNTEVWRDLVNAYTKAAHAFIKDYSGHYWIGSMGVKLTKPSASNGYRIRDLRLFPKPFYEGIMTELADTDAALAAAVSATGRGSAYETIKAVHDYVIRQINYPTGDLSPRWYHTITGGLLGKYDHLGVCECYAKLFQQLCQAHGIPCVLITGGSKRNGDGTVADDHMWNYVQLDGAWYLVDATWDDKEQESGKYRYFLVGSETVVSGRRVADSHMPVGRFWAGVDYKPFFVPMLALQAAKQEENLQTSVSHVPGEAASCTSPQKCTKCGAVLQAATGHKPGSWTVTKKATGTKTGTKVRRCLVCKKTVSTAVIPKTYVKLSAASLPLQLKKSSSALKIVKKTAGDTVSKWTSSNSRVVVVNSRTGLLRAKKTGRATITVTMKSGAKASCRISVQKSPVRTKKLTLGKTALTLKRGKTAVISVSRTPVTATDKITYKSSNTKVATVTSKGKITGKRKGTAKITVRTSGGKKATVRVTVK